MSSEQNDYKYLRVCKSGTCLSQHLSADHKRQKRLPGTLSSGLLGGKMFNLGHLNLNALLPYSYYKPSWTVNIFFKLAYPKTIYETQEGFDLSSGSYIVISANSWKFDCVILNSARLMIFTVKIINPVFLW